MFQDYLLHNHNKNNFQFQKINEETTVSSIDKLAPKSSFGFNSIFTKLIETLNVTLIKPITLIIKQILNTEIFPDKPKVAKIKPTQQQKDIETLFTNYRPISLLLEYSKIFKKQLFD